MTTLRRLDFAVECQEWVALVSSTEVVERPVKNASATLVLERQQCVGMPTLMTIGWSSLDGHEPSIATGG